MRIVIVIVIVIFPMRALGSNLAPVHELPILGSYYVVAHRHRCVEHISLQDGNGNVALPTVATFV